MLQEHRTIIEQIRALAAPLSAAERLALIRAIASLDAPPRKSPTKRQKAPEEVLDAEQEAWFARPEVERQRYTGEYVAVYRGEIVDHDHDQRGLYLRVQARYGDQPVLIVHSDWNAPPELFIHSPQMER